MWTFITSDKVAVRQVMHFVAAALIKSLKTNQYPRYSTHYPEAEQSTTPVYLVDFAHSAPPIGAYSLGERRNFNTVEAGVPPPHYRPYRDKSSARRTCYRPAIGGCWL